MEFLQAVVLIVLVSYVAKMVRQVLTNFYVKNREKRTWFFVIGSLITFIAQIGAVYFIVEFNLIESTKVVELILAVTIILCITTMHGFKGYSRQINENHKT